MKRSRHITHTAQDMRWKYPLPLFLLSITCAIFLFFVVRSYMENFKNTLNQETQTYMSEIAQQVTQVINERVIVNIRNLQTEASAIVAMKPQSTKEVTDFMRIEARRYGYSEMSAANTDGIAWTCRETYYNVASRKHYLAALQGKSGVSGVLSSSFNNTDCIEFAVPITANNEIRGVLLASYSLSAFYNILQVSMFDHRGSALIIDNQGVVIVNGGSESPYNFFYFLKKAKADKDHSIERFISDISLGYSGVLNYTADGTSNILYYQPLGINDWFILINVPADIITKKTEILVQISLCIGIVIAVTVALLMYGIITVQNSSQKALKKLLYTDPVTEGLTQVKFEMDAKKLTAEKENGYYALVQINLEKFKLINTAFGREAGNATLKYVYKTISAHLAQDELAARFTADRFCLLLRFETQEKMTARLFSLCEAINSFNDNLENKYIFHFSMGICIPDDTSQDINLSYEQANFARIHGKGKLSEIDSILFYDDVDRNILLREKEIENRMQEALNRGEFEIYLQPKYELANNTIAGAEALIRWNDPQKGLISPGDFIPLFERNGFIVKLDLYVFERVCVLLQKWYEEGRTCFPISVNLSRIHLNFPNFLDKYRNIYQQCSFPARFVEIEITESAIFENMDMLCTVITEMHKLGFRCSLDDFGSGYSSLNMLKDIHVDALKLDRAFFYSNDNDTQRIRYVVENVINLAEKLHMETIAEGVETQEQVTFLREANCGLVQGFVFAKPMQVDLFMKLAFGV